MATSRPTTTFTRPLLTLIRACIFVFSIQSSYTREVLTLSNLKSGFRDLPKCQHEQSTLNPVSALAAVFNTPPPALEPLPTHPLADPPLFIIHIAPISPQAQLQPAPRDRKSTWKTVTAVVVPTRAPPRAQEGMMMIEA